MAGEPMLAYKVESVAELKSLPYPLYVAKKYDGVRGFGEEGVVLSRKLKEFRNNKLQDWAAEYAGVIQDLDFEIIVGKPNGPLVMNRAQSFTSSFDSTEDFDVYVFDWLGDFKMPFEERYEIARKRAAMLPNAILVEQVLVKNYEELLALETSIVEDEYEGIIIRRPGSPYRNGRPGKRQMYMMKWKRWVDREATIIGYQEEMHNANEALTNELGRTKRQSLQENMVGKGTLGAFICEDKPFFSETFNVGNGPGMTQALRAEWWKIRDSLIGKTITYRYFPVGIKDRPRFPQWLSFRHDL